MVDTDETASKVLDIMTRERTGRVTFMPLNRLKPKDVTYPNADDAIPLIKKLSFDPKMDKAFKQVFGKTCVCRDLAVAAAYVRSHQLNTITLEGDKVDRKGALTGGYHDIRRSRLDAVKNVTTWREKYDTDNARIRDVKKSILQLEQEITKLVGQMQIATNQRTKMQQLREPLIEEATLLSREHDRLKERLSRGETDVEDLKTELVGLRARIEDHEKELQLPLVQGLSSEEQAMLNELGKEAEMRQKVLVELGKTRTQVSTILFM